MKHLKKTCLLILLLFVSFNVVVAQKTQPTPYQKKQLELSKKWFQILSGYEMSMSDEVFYEQLTAGKEANDFVLGLAILNYAMYNSKSQCEKIFTQMNNEFKQAEKLKNATDFRLEKEAKDRKDQEVIEKTDLGSIRKNIKYAFEQWNQKGEFEKETDYTDRLQNQSQTAFEGICLEKIKNRINSFSSYNWRKELSTYNSENEFFTVFFKINNIEWQSNISIPITQAPNFKTDWPDLDFVIDDYDWCFVENSLCPNLVTLKNQYNKTGYKLPLTLNNQTEISYSFDNLSIDNKYLKGYVFRYSNAKKIAEQQEREKQRLDSIELVTYNQKLDSIFKNYNRQLLENPYNVGKKVMSDYKKVAGKNDREYNFNNSLSSIKYNYEQLTKDFTREYENEFRKNEKLFANKDEFGTFNKKGNEDYQLEIEKRTTMNYLSVNSQFIESMDFQKEKKEPISPPSVYGYSTPTIDYTEINKKRKSILSAISESKTKLYYSQILDFVIETNKDMNKEWNKNGQYFENKSEFYNAYISDDYKKILKENKKK